MRAYRQRKRDRLRCVTLDLREREIDRLVELGYLSPDDRCDRDKIMLAVYWFLEVGPLADAHQ